MTRDPVTDKTVRTQDSVPEADGNGPKGLDARAPAESGDSVSSDKPDGPAPTRAPNSAPGTANLSAPRSPDSEPAPGVAPSSVAENGQEKPRQDAAIPLGENEAAKNQAAKSNPAETPPKDSIEDATPGQAERDIDPGAQKQADHPPTDVLQTQKRVRDPDPTPSNDDQGRRASNESPGAAAAPVANREMPSSDGDTGKTVGAHDDRPPKQDAAHRQDDQPAGAQASKPASEPVPLARPPAASATPAAEPDPALRPLVGDRDEGLGEGRIEPSLDAPVRASRSTGVIGSGPARTHGAAVSPAIPQTAMGLMLSSTRLVEMNWFQATALFIGIITILRLFVVVLSDMTLQPDEAQYWIWSQDPAFGYFSKPPVLAWTIGVTTALFGTSEAAVRLASPLYYAGTSLCLFLLAQGMFNGRTAFLASITFATLPGVWFSSTIISTDVPLLFFWSLALLALWRTVTRFSIGWAVVLGLAVGMGLMSKYAMLYFVLGSVLFLAADSEARRAMLGWRGFTVVVLAGAIFTPNVLWNLSNDFATVSHTAANANWAGPMLNPGKMGYFVLGQFAVFGPLLFAALVWGFLTITKRFPSGVNHRAILFLILFTVPPLLIVSFQAFLSRAHANWAATAYVAASVLVVVWLSNTRLRPVVAISFLIHVAAGVLLYATILSPGLLETLGRSNDFKRMQGWDEIGAEVSWRARSGHGGRQFTAVMAEGRGLYAQLAYYAAPLPVPLTIWDKNGIPENHFELKNPITEPLSGKVLLVTRKRDPAKILARFRRMAYLGSFPTDIGGGKQRVFHFYALETLMPHATDFPDADMARLDPISWRDPS